MSFDTFYSYLEKIIPFHFKKAFLTSANKNLVPIKPNAGTLCEPSYWTKKQAAFIKIPPVFYLLYALLHLSFIV